jgi:hypothetical protein
LKRFRFSLWGLLLLVTAAALFFGYAQWRRLYITREYGALRAEGVYLAPLEDSWWPAAPHRAVVVFILDGSGKWRHNQNAYSTAEAKRRYLEWEARLKRMGVPSVGLGIQEMDGRESLILPEDLDDYAR